MATLRDSYRAHTGGGWDGEGNGPSPNAHGGATGPQGGAPEDGGDRSTSTVWTPSHCMLYHLIAGIYAFTEDRDDVHAVEELKRATKWAKQTFGMQHPFVVEGLWWLAVVYRTSGLGEEVNRETEEKEEAGEESPQDRPNHAAAAMTIAVQVAAKCCKAVLLRHAWGDTQFAGSSDGTIEEKAAQERWGQERVLVYTQQRKELVDVMGFLPGAASYDSVWGSGSMFSPLAR